MKTSAQKLTLYTVVVLIVALLALFLWQRATPQAATPTGADFQLGQQPMLGDPDAPVTIVAFEDFMCPVCRRFEDQAFPQIERELIDTGLAKMYFVNFQFIGPSSTRAGIAGECAYQQNEAAFWDYKTYLYRSQGPEREDWATPRLLVDVARDYVPELDPEALATCIEERRYEDEVRQDADIARAAGVGGTPTLFVNGEQLESWDFRSVRAAVEAARE